MLFAFQIYSLERILDDKAYLKEMFYGAPIRDYMLRAPADQKAEFTALEEELISNSVAWERIKIFVDVENPIRQLLRVSDGHVPNLSSIALGNDVAKAKCTAAIAAAQVKYPDLYGGHNISVTHLLEKRKKDIVTPLCLAATMVVPGLVYIEEGKVA